MSYRGNVCESHSVLSRRANVKRQGLQPMAIANKKTFTLTGSTQTAGSTHGYSFLAVSRPFPNDFAQLRPQYPNVIV